MWFELTYTFLGGMGLFFYGMKILSEALQSISGDFVRRVIRSVTDNRIMGVLVGIAITALLQSSTLTTVMIVSLVNAQLMSLAQAIGIIFGANIGTTVTGWLIAIKVGSYGLLFIGVGVLPLLMAKHRVIKQIGHLILSLGLVFMGIQIMTGAFKPLRESEGFAQILSHFAANDWLSLLACIGTGAVLTMLIHSSAAVVAITMALAMAGNISFQTSVALMLGGEIGTTITAIMASIGTSTNAKRAARAHAVFNIVGVLLLASCFWLYVDFIDKIVGGDPNAFNDAHERPWMAAHIAASQTFFNVIATIVFLPFLKTLERFVIWITPDAPVKETPHLLYLTPSVDLQAPALGLAMAERELLNLADITGRAVDATEKLLLAKHFDQKAYDKIHHYEEVTDAIQKEITVFLCRIQQAPLAPDQTLLAHSIIQAADELESVADYCAGLARALSRLNQGGEAFTEPALADLHSYTRAVMGNYRELLAALQKGEPLDQRHFEREKEALAHEGNRLRDQHRQRLETRNCTPIAGMIFTDLIVGLRKLKGHTLDVVKALSIQA